MPEFKDLAIVSVSDKTNVVDMARYLAAVRGLQLVGSGGTAEALRKAGLDVQDVSSITGVTEMLGGRVKTLHPAVHAGILATDSARDTADLDARRYRRVRVVVCNLYPFESTVGRADSTLEMAVENIDIGGVTLLRAAAKNHAHVTVLCSPTDYAGYMDGRDDTEYRRSLALKAFEHTARYDTAIALYMRQQTDCGARLPLRYGMNPHQKPAELAMPLGVPGDLPLKVRNGSPGYINLLDALNAYQLVKELATTVGLPAATSFKHVSPAGAAVAVALSADELRAYMLDEHTSASPLATAYARARGADRMSSFGDFIAVSHIVDVPTAKLIAREVSDGIIAPAYEPEALELLGAKKGGNYTVLEMDSQWTPAAREQRTVYGLQLVQSRNNAVIDENALKNVVSRTKAVTDEAVRDLLVAAITLKYTQSNSVCYATRGQAIGVGAGQQSRIHCTRLAGDKALNWWMRQHPRVLELPFVAHTKRAVRANAVDMMVGGCVGKDVSLQEWQSHFTEPVQPLEQMEIDAWQKKMHDVVVASDAFFPFRDNIDRIAQYGVTTVAAPAGSNNDAAVTAACDEHGIALVHTAIRLFHH